MESEPRVVHVLTAGAALCGQPGLPKNWPKNHWWVRVEDVAQANCPGCLKALFEKAKAGK